MTDSAIVSFDAWYRFILQKVYSIDMPIKHEKFDMVEVIKADEFGELDKKVMCHIVEPQFDYDFYTDEEIETQRYIEPAKIVPQDMLKFAIINIIAYVCSNLVVDYLREYSKLTGSYVEGRKCALIMKNEYLMQRVLLTQHRRNYASYQVLQEGNIIPESESLSIAGLPIDKSTLPEDIKEKFKKILTEDIMVSEEVDQIAIMKKLILMENTIYKSIMNKETKYYKPDNVAPMNSYAKNPLEVNGVVACLIYNEMKDDDMPAINMEERNAIIKIKIDVNKKNVDKIKDLYPVEYDKLVRLLNHPTLGSKINVIALPPDSQVPDWVLEFVDFGEIISDSLKNFPLQSIGLNRLDNDSVNVSNIIKL
jgi:uncharacterized membrane protein YwzB